MFLADQEIASTRAEFFKGDACQGRPMGICPSVPVEYLFRILVIIEHLFFLIRITFQQRSSVRPC